MKKRTPRDPLSKFMMQFYRLISLGFEGDVFMPGNDFLDEPELPDPFIMTGLEDDFLLDPSDLSMSISMVLLAFSSDPDLSSHGLHGAQGPGR